MSVNSFALPNYIIPELKELAEKELIDPAVIIFSNPNRIVVTLASDIDSRWRTLSAGASIIILLASGAWHGDDDLCFIPGDNQDQNEDQFSINTDELRDWENLRLALQRWKYEGIDPTQGQ